MVKSDLKKSIPFKSYSKNSESRSKEFLINIPIFVLQRYLCYEYLAMCYEYLAMCYEVYLMCYESRPSRKIIFIFTKDLTNLNLNWVLVRR